MQSINRKWLFLSIGILLLLFHLPEKTIATYLNDPEDDVWSINAQAKGNYAEYIDIHQIAVDGSHVIIECKGAFSKTEDNISLSYLVMFNDDGDPTDWEAAFIIQYRAGYGYTARWTVGDPTIGVEYWQVDNAGIHYSVNATQIIFNFLEYQYVSVAEIMVKTTAKLIPLAINDRLETVEVYYDWVPDFYEERGFTAEIFITQSIPEFTSTTSPTETTPVTTSPTETTPLTTSSTETIPLTTSTKAAPPAIPGFELLPIVAVIPLLCWLRRRIR